jgi:hypothetical protein
MATAYKPTTPEEVIDCALDAAIRESAQKAHAVIQKARERMSPEDRERADRNGEAILNEASAAAKRSQRGA